MIIPYIPESFDVFYTLAITFAILVLFYVGIRRNYPTITWSAAILTTTLFTILFARITTLNPIDWKNLFLEGVFQEAGRTIIGALLGCLLGLLFSVKVYKISTKVFDLVGFVLPLSMIIQRFGCLFIGCCNGTPTNLPWAIHYEKFSVAHFLQAHSGIIHQNDLHTTGVHPNPIYQMLACAIIFCLLYFYFRFKVKRSGSIFLISIGTYLLSRFVTEFFRDPLSNGYAGNVSVSLKLVQWIVLLFAGILFFIIWIREKNYKRVIGFSKNESNISPDVSTLLIILPFILSGLCMLFLPAAEKTTLILLIF